MQVIFKDKNCDVWMSVPDGSLAKVCIDIARNRAPSVIAKAIMKSQLCQVIINEMFEILETESRLLCRKHQCSLQHTGFTDLVDISFSNIIAEWRELAPLFLRSIQTVLNEKKKMKIK